MSDLLNEIGDYLATAGVGTVATNIFIGVQPAEPANCISLFGLLGANIGNQREVASLNFPRFQVVVRNEAYDTASDKLAAVRAALHNKYGLILPNWRIMRCHAEQEGGPIGEDAQGRYEFSINFMVEANAETAPA